VLLCLKIHVPCPIFCRCLSEKCYRELFPEPIEDGEVISSVNTRLKRCLREELKVQKAIEAHKENEREKQRRKAEML